ncbi:MAG: hypothetical protein ACM34N_15130, partial [Ignavibacteria bacterium]
MKNIFLSAFFLPLIISSLIILSCNEADEGFAPYAGSPEMSGITIQDGSYKPEMTWLGGYVSVVGVNYGSRAALDPSLVFLLYSGGNNISYPVTFGEIPQGAQDLTSQYGGTRVDNLIEDSTYTFWVMKETEWNQISSLTDKILIYDSTLSSSIQINGDT